MILLLFEKMGNLFKDMLASNQTLFKDETALSYDFIPKLMPYREVQQRHIASCIKPMFQGRSGRNLFIYGAPGIGKTVACKHIFNELEEETEDILPIYINCWQKNTSHKIILEICDVLGYKLTHNKSTDELVEDIKETLNEKAIVFAFDEIDKVEDFDFLYTLLEEINKKAVFLITNYKTWFDELEDRIKSRLMAEAIEFKHYNYHETKGILQHRKEYAFYPGIWDDKAFELVVGRTAKLQDIRLGLYLLKEAGMIAENVSSKNILEEHTKKAIEKIDEFTTKDEAGLNKEEKFILEIIRGQPNMKMGELFKKYQQKGGSLSYKSFQRKINVLYENRFVVLEKTGGGKGGNVTIVKLLQIKELTDF